MNDLPLVGRSKNLLQIFWVGVSRILRPPTYAPQAAATNARP